jgi:hypothetical protein
MMSILAQIKAFKKETSDDETHTQELKRQDDGTRNIELIEPPGIKVAE